MAGAGGAKTGILRSFAVYAAGATFGPTKRWPTQFFAETAGASTPPTACGRSSWARATPASARPRLRWRRQREAPRSPDETDLPVLVGVLADAALFVGNDSGPMHAASAVGIPTVGIFGSTSPVWTAPRGPAARSVGPAPVACSPCFRSTCPFALECLRELEPAAVLQAVEQVLGPTPPQRIRR